MDAYFTSDDQIHKLTSKLHTYVSLHVPEGLYLLLAKAHVATSTGSPVPPATEASLNGGALVRLRIGDQVLDQSFATVTGQWEIGINHEVVSLMSVEKASGEDPIELEAVGIPYTLPILTQLRLTALPLDAVHSGRGIAFKREADVSALLQSLTAAGVFPH